MIKSGFFPFISKASIKSKTESSLDKFRKHEKYNDWQNCVSELKEVLKERKEIIDNYEKIKHKKIKIYRKVKA